MRFSQSNWISKQAKWHPNRTLHDYQNRDFELRLDPKSIMKQNTSIYINSVNKSHHFEKKLTGISYWMNSLFDTPWSLLPGRTKTSNCHAILHKFKMILQINHFIFLKFCKSYYNFYWLTRHCMCRYYNWTHTNLSSIDDNLHPLMSSTLRLVRE